MSSPTFGFSATLPFNRPTNATPYDASDAVGSATSAYHTLDTKLRAQTLIRIESASLTINQNGAPPSAQWGIRLFNGMPTGALIDGATFTTAAANRSLYSGLITLPAALEIGGGFWHSFNNAANQIIRLNSSQLVAVLVMTSGAWTPASGGEIILRLAGSELGGF